jgi:fibronectin type 3 domain-containing protein
MRNDLCRRALTVAASATVMLASAVVVGGPLASLSGVASAATNDQGISGTPSSMWQTNNDVDTIVASGGVIYAGGKFTSVRPPGSPSGSNETARTYLAAFNASTGALVTSFNVTLNGAVKNLAVSPDGKTLYVAGSFSTVNGLNLPRLAAINIPSGTPNTSFVPNPNKVVWSVTATATTVYLGGDFTTVKGVSQANLASVSASTGAINTAFAPTLVARPNVNCFPGFLGCPASGVQTYPPHPLSLKVAPDGSRLLVGGNFIGVNGSSTGGMASVDPNTGATEEWDANGAPPAGQPINTNCAGRVTGIAVQGTTAFVTAEGDPPGCYEGTYSAQISNGALNWNSSCLGASQAIVVLNNILYKGSHQHDCSANPGGAMGGFVGGSARDDFIHHWLVAQNISDGTFVHWTPITNATGSKSVGPHTMATDGTQIIVGGDFTTVNGSAQQGIARFAPGNQATPKTPGQSITADAFGGQPGVANAAYLPITVQPTAPGTLTIEVPAVEDYDNGTLTYSIYRDNGSTPIYTGTMESYPWSRPVLRYDDTGLAPGSTHSYRVSASDGVHTSNLSASVSGTVASSAPASFEATTKATSPLAWWRLDDNGSTAADSSGNGNTGVFEGGVTTGQPGALGGDNAITLDGTSGYVTSSSPISEPGAFTESAWFKTTSTTGGVIVAQTSGQTGSGGTTDRMIAMDNNGGLVFAVQTAGSGPFGPPPPLYYRNQGPIWNDGKWHQVVGTYDGQGTLTLYVDGQLQGTVSPTPNEFTGQTSLPAGMNTSYLRAGYAATTGIQTTFGINYYDHVWPLSGGYFQGSLDEVSSYGSALSGGQIQSLFAAEVAQASSGGAPTIPAAPSAPTVTAGSSSLNVAWPAVPGATSYQVLRAPDGTNNYSTIGSNIASPSFNDSGVTAGGAYDYEIEATNSAGTSAASASTEFTVPAPPASPPAPTVTAAAATSANVSWSPVSGATSYQVLRAPDGTNNYSTVGTNISGTSYTDTGLTGGTAYDYEIEATNSGGNSVPSPFTVYTTPSTPAAPSAPAVTTAGANSASVSWPAVSGATTYQVLRADDGANNYSTVGTNVSGTSYTDTGLTQGSAYDYEVEATNLAGTSGPSPATVYTQPVQIPAAPSAPTVTAAQETSANVTWPSVPNATSYQVLRAPDGTNNYSTVGPNVSGTSYTDTGLTLSASYDYEIEATNSAGTSAASPSTEYIVAPDAATGVTARASSSTSVSVSWNAVSGAQGYEVDRSTSSNGTYSAVATNLATTTYTDTSVSANSTYYYKVVASNAGGPGPASSAASTATPLLSNSFEGGSNGTAISSSNSNGASGSRFNTVSCSGGALNYTSTTAANGSLSAAFTPSTSACYLQWSNASTGTSTTSYGRVYVRLTGSSSTAQTLLKLADSSGTRDAQLVLSTSGAVVVYDANNTKQYTFSNSLVGQGWVRVEWSLTNSTTAGSLTVTLYNGNSTTPIATQTVNNINTGASFGNLQVGSVTSTSAALKPFNIDDVGYGTAGPLGPAS